MVTTLSEAIGNGVAQYACTLSDFVLGQVRAGNPLFLVYLPGAKAGQAAFQCSVREGVENNPFLGTEFTGGQCQVFYNLRVRGRYRRQDGFEETVTSNQRRVRGPVQGLRLISTPGSTPGSTVLSVVVQSASGDTEGISTVSQPPSNAIQWLWYRIIDLRREDGQPDNCGNPPLAPYPRTPSAPSPYPPAPPNPPNPPGTFPPITINVLYAPVSLGFELNVPIDFGGVNFNGRVSFPITIPVSVGGIRIGDVRFNFEDGVEYVPAEPTPVTEPPPECPDLTTIVVPFAIRESCSQSSAEIEVSTNSLPPALVGRLIDTVNLALESCGEESSPEQEPEVLLSSGTAPAPSAEQFVSVPDDCVSVRLRITGAGSARQVTTFGATGQRKYGSLGFALSNMAGGGDYVYIYDNETYYPLPPRAKPGRIRLLLSPGVQWQLYDTGERL